MLQWRQLQLHPATLGEGVAGEALFDGQLRPNAAARTEFS